MKRKIAILMASMMALTAPMNAFAASFDAPLIYDGDTQELARGEVLTNDMEVAFYLNYDDKEISKGSEITLTLSNAEFATNNDDEVGSVYHFWGGADRRGNSNIDLELNASYNEQEKAIENYLKDNSTLKVTITSEGGDVVEVEVEVDYSEGNLADSIISALNTNTDTKDEYTDFISTIEAEELEEAEEETPEVDQLEDNVVDAQDESTEEVVEETQDESTEEVVEETQDESTEEVVEAELEDDGVAVVSEEYGVEVASDVMATTATGWGDVFTADGDTLTLKSGHKVESITADLILDEPTYGIPYVITYDGEENEATLTMLYEIDENEIVQMPSLTSGLSVLESDDSDDSDDSDFDGFNDNGTSMEFDEYDGLFINFRGIVGTNSDDEEASITVEASSDDIDVDSSTLEIATGTAQVSGTSATITASTYNIDDDVFDIEDITITESSSTSFEAGGSIKLTLSSGFAFYDYDEDSKVSSSGVEVGTVTSANGTRFSNDVSILSSASSGRVATFDLEENGEYNSGSTLEELTISGLQVVSTGGTGEITLTIEGSSSKIDNVTYQELVIGTVGEKAFSLTTPNVYYEDSDNYDDYDEDDDTHMLDVPAIGAGRFYQITNALGGDVESEANLSAVVNFSEVIDGSLRDDRNLEFKVPEGVKIVNVVDLDENLDNITFIDGVMDLDSNGDPIDDITSDIAIRDNGQTLRISKDCFSNDASVSSLEFQLELSVDPYYATGDGLNEDGTKDITLTASNSGADDVSVVIAKAITPFSFDVSNTYVESGSTGATVSDITIKENYPGAFLVDGWVTLEMTGLYGADGLTFLSTTPELTVEALDEEEGTDDELSISNPRVNLSGGLNKIVFQVQSGTTDSLGSITLKDVKIGTSRTVPLGSYDIQIGGDAIINNYSEEGSGTSNTFETNNVNTGNNSDDNDFVIYNFNDVNDWTDNSSYDSAARGEIITGSGNDKALMNLVFHETSSVYQIDDFVTVVEEGYVGSKPGDIVVEEKFEGVVAVTIGNADIKSGLNGEVTGTTTAKQLPFVKTDIEGYEGIPTTLVPVRAIVEAMGATIPETGDDAISVTYMNTSKGMQYVTYVNIFLKDGTKVTLNNHPDRSNIAIINDTQSVTMAIPVQQLYTVNTDGTTGNTFFVPLRALAEILGDDVKVWWGAGSNEAAGDIKYGTKGTAFYYSTKAELNAFLEKQYGVEEEVVVEEEETTTEEASDEESDDEE